MALKEDLEGLHLPEDILILHHVGNVLIAAAPKGDCLTATRTPLHRMAECDYKVKQTKIATILTNDHISGKKNISTRHGSC